MATSFLGLGNEKPDWDAENPQNPKNVGPGVGPNVPFIVTQEDVEIMTPAGVVTIPNPMWKYTLKTGTFGNYGIKNKKDRTGRPLQVDLVRPMINEDADVVTSMQIVKLLADIRKRTILKTQITKTPLFRAKTRTGMKSPEPFVASRISIVIRFLKLCIGFTLICHRTCNLRPWHGEVDSHRKRTFLWKTFMVTSMISLEDLVT